jgi:imidazolonepropionase-like amidohydrolase
MMDVFMMLTLSFLGYARSPGQGVEALALVGATVFPSPTESPIPDGVVVIRGGTIDAVGPRDRTPVPPEATRVNCEDLYVTAGFQNSHVHFTEPHWEGAARAPAEKLFAQLEEMLLRHGFTTVVDTGSVLQNTLDLRRRIESGEVRGPRILTAGTPMYPADGIPYYLRNSLPPEVLSILPTPRSREEAEAVAHAQLGAGADIVKLFTGSWVDRGRVLPMPAAIARAASEEAHRQGKLVFSHASNIAGLEVALEAGVDVIAHALDDDRGWTESHVARMKEARMAMIPTLKLFGGQSYTKYIQQEVGDLSRAGGQILFGTDVGYMTDYDPTEEYVLMAGAGLDWRQILAALTTAPSERFGEAARRGRVAPGLDADLVVLAADPSADVKAFSGVRYTVRGGRVVYGR